MNANDWKFTPLGECGLLVRWNGDAAATAILRKLAQRLRVTLLHGVTDCVPSTDSLLLYFDPEVVTAGELMVWVGTYGVVDAQPLPNPTVTIISVQYGGVNGPDLESVAAAVGLTPAEVVALHTAVPMEVQLLGFMPGFPYIGGLPSTLHLPRRAEPRVAVPAGSVAIANGQTGIYPATAPGGWHLIGRTAEAMFDPQRVPPNVLEAGNYVQFVVDSNSSTLP